MTVEGSDIWTFDFDPKKLHEKYLAERDKRLRSEGGGQYLVIGSGRGEKYASWLKDPWATPIERKPMDVTTTVLILGGGFTTVILANELLKRGVTDFQLIDRAGDFGGTWYWNRYPGACCDSEAYAYFPLLEETGFVPSHKYPFGSEILAYTQQLARDKGLHQKTIFQTAVRELHWEDDEKVWKGTTDRGDSITAKFVVTAAGPLNQPHLPDVPGIETFKGHEFHTSRWDYAYTGGSGADGADLVMDKLKDKRVAIVGTGATAVQVIPFLGKSAGKLYVFQRTPSAVDVRDQIKTDVAWYKSQPAGWQKKRNDSIAQAFLGMKPEVDCDDGFSRSFNQLSSLVHRQLATGEHKEYSIPELVQLADYRLMEKIRRRCDEVVTDKRTAELLKPWYNLMCKRPVYSDIYLPTFNLPNVELVDTSETKGITRVTEKGIVVGDKEYEVDCIVWSTGFFITGLGVEMFDDFVVRGRGGLTIKERNAQNGGYASLYGVCFNGFPNHFAFKYAQAAPHINVPVVFGDQSRFIAYVIATALKQGVATIEPSRQAEEDWTKEVLEKSGENWEFRQTCTPGYYNAEGNIKFLKEVDRAQLYGAGYFAYRDKLDAYIASGTLDQMDIGK